MSLDIEAMKAIVGESRVSLESAKRILEETCVSVDDVSDPDLKCLWSVLEARVRERQPIDLFGIARSLKSQPRAAQAAEEIISGYTLGLAFERLSELRDAGIRSRLVAGLRKIAKDSGEGKSLSELSGALRLLPEILKAGGSRVRNCSGDYLKHMDRLDSLWNGRGIPKIQMGLGDLDEALGGLINNLIVLGARPGVGKSALVAGLVRNWLKSGIKVGVLCYEDDALDMQARLIAHSGGVPLRVARGDILASKIQQQYTSDGIEWLHGVGHLLEVDDDRPSGTSSDVVATIHAMVDRGARVILLDNMTCVRLDKVDSRHDLVVEAALRDIRDCAQSLGVPIIVAGHMRRTQDGGDEANKPPKLSDFSNAMAWENYSRVALGMWKGENGNTLLKVMKQTNGPPGDVFDLQMNTEAAVVIGATKKAPEEIKVKTSGSRFSSRTSNPNDDT